MLNGVEQEENGLCITSCLCKFSETFGLQCSQEGLEAILGILGFFYTNSKREDGNVLHGMNAVFTEIFERYQTMLQKPLGYAVLKHGFDVVEQCAGILKMHGPSLVWVDEKSMSYSPYYQKASSRSLVILYKMDHDKTVYYDRRMRECDTEFFLKSINQEVEKRIYYSQSEALKFKYTGKHAIMIGLDKVISGMISNHIVDNEYHGFIGMKHFFADAKQCISTDTFYNYYYQINRPGGLSYTRNSMEIVLEKTKKLIDEEHIFALEKVYSELAQDWRLVGNMFFRLSQRMDSFILERNIKRLQSVIQKEEEAIKNLSYLFDSIVKEREGEDNE